MSEQHEPVEAISAVTLLTRDMAAAVDFYTRVGFRPLYGGGQEAFTSFRAGGGYLNIQLDEAFTPTEGIWGRVVFWVEDVDAMYTNVLRAGFTAESPPADAPWGERYFHVRGPDGHELSFARPLSSG